MTNEPVAPNTVPQGGPVMTGTAPEPPVEGDVRRDDAKADTAAVVAGTPASGSDKPWYLDPPKVAGVLAFVLSLSTVGERLWVRDQELVQQRLQQLREVTVSLADIQGEYLEALTKAPSNIYALGVATNTKRQMHLQTAAALLDYPDVHRQASSHIFGALAAEVMSDGRYEAAKTYFEEALKAPGADDSMKPLLFRALAQLHRLPNTSFANADIARQYFEQALGMFDKRLDDTGHVLWAETVLTAANSEITFGDLARGKALAQQARERLARCRVLSPVRTQLERLADAFERGEQYSQTQDGALQPTPAVQGPPPQPPSPQQPPLQQQPQPQPSTGGPQGSQTTRSAAIEVWAPIPGQISGVEMDVYVDGKQVGRLSNGDNAPRQLQVADLSPGIHKFAYARMNAYFIDPVKGRSLTASGFACAGLFELAADRNAFKVNVGSGPNGMMCTLQ
jgi:hypothetical protein